MSETALRTSWKLAMGKAWRDIWQRGGMAFIFLDHRRGFDYWLDLSAEQLSPTEQGDFKIGQRHFIRAKQLRKDSPVDRKHWFTASPLPPYFELTQILETEPLPIFKFVYMTD